MNKLQALLIAGLLSLTSVSFASSLALGDYAGDTVTTLGTITLDDLTVVTDVNGTFAAAGEKDLWLIDLAMDKSVVAFGDITFGKLNPILTYELFSDEALSVQVGNTGVNELIVSALTAGKYYLQLTAGDAGSYNVHVSAVPVPAAGILFASALLGAGAFGRRKKKAQASVVGAFARVS